MGKRNPQGTYVPQLQHKEPETASRETEDAFQRIHSDIRDILHALANSGVSVGGATGINPNHLYYQKVGLEDAGTADQRETLSFKGGGVSIDDLGDRTLVTIGDPSPVPTPDGSSENLNDFFLFNAVQNYALRPILAKTYR